MVGRKLLATVGGDMTSDNDIEVLKLRDDWYARAKKQTMETLPAFLQELHAYKHDYNTICYAIAAAAIAAAWSVERSPSGGITGFQAGAIMWEFMRGWNGIEAPAWLRRGENMLYPQYADDFTSISTETFAWLKTEAAKKLAEHDVSFTSSVVVEHWQSIVDGVVPFGLQLRA